MNRFAGEDRQEDTMRAVGVTPRDADAERELAAGAERSLHHETSAASSRKTRQSMPPRSPLARRGNGRPTPERVDEMRGHDLADRLALLGDVTFGLVLADNADRQVAESLGRVLAQRRGLVGAAIMTDNRNPEVVAARTSLCRVLRKMGWSLPRIGKAIGRDHTSVLHLLRRDERTA